MAMRLVLVFSMLLAVALMCSLIHHVSSAVDCRDGCIPTTTETSSSSSSSSSSLTNTEIRSRKLLLHNNAEEVFKSYYAPVLLDHHHHQQQGGGNVNVHWSSLRVVPSGPDPLHHRGSGPNDNP